VFFLIYALDIGTRTVVGVLAEKFDNSIIIYDCEVREHEERAMLDGAIHDVNKVSKIVSEITKELEGRNDVELDKVSVALAGRFLKTSLGEANSDVKNKHVINEDMVRLLEMEAINDSINTLDTDGREMYCVGYSVLYYNLNGEWIKNLVGQSGNEASVKVISAFLPAYVVNAMMNVLENSGLKPSHITLEPIAAINLVVPQDLRKLNIALVDVGAGTSDIAVSRDGTVIAYGMVPMAGDEITEKICETFLVDFKTAESIKRNLSNGEESISVKDILDCDIEIKKEEFINLVTPVIDEITSKIVDEIINLNGKSPVAMMIVGGGAKVPEFGSMIANKLSLPANRVALKTVENLNAVEDKKGILTGSDMITPVGIANSINTNTGSVFVRVMVNGNSLDLMGMDNKNTIIQALLQLGYGVEEIIGKPGPAITIEKDGEILIYKGTTGKEAEIMLNEKAVGIHTKLQHGDIIEFKPGKEGESPELFVSDVVDKIDLIINGEKKEILPKVKINGNYITGDIEIKDGDNVETKKRLSVSELLEILLKSEPDYIRVILNGMPKSLASGKHEVYRNSILLNNDDEIKPGDIIEIKHKEFRPVVRNLINGMEQNYCKVFVNSSEIKIPITKFSIQIDGLKADLDSPLFDEAVIDVDMIEIKPQLVDLLGQMELDVSNLRDFSIKKNGISSSSFMDNLDEGDQIEIILEK